MREIKYQAWVKNAKEIVQVGAIQFPDPANTARLSFVVEWNGLRTWTLDQVELREYTGLKDCKGQDIYEGDIVRYYAFGIQGTVTWVANGPCFTILRSDKTVACVLHSEWEAIGNIYEHPHLLEEK